MLTIQWASGNDMSISQEDLTGKDDVWQIIVDILNKYGDFPVYPPAMHNGECTEPYLVVKEDGSARVPSYSSQYRYVRIMLYVPRNQYSKLGEYQKRVEKIIEEKIFPLLLPTGQIESDYYDDNYNAHMRAMLYRYVRRNKLL